MNDEQLSALLRLKRYEQPPEGYFDQLLRDVHRRQRAELLKRPLWKIAADRVQTFFSEHSLGGLSYAGSMAAVLIMGAAAIGFMTSGGGQSGVAVAVREEAAPAPVVAQVAQAGTETRSLPTAAVTTPRPDLRQAQAPLDRRYIIDARPASYEPAFSF